jgi:hypothetical protein
MKERSRSITSRSTATSVARSSSSRSGVAGIAHGVAARGISIFTPFDDTK